jgi:tripartite-type tricarboxylate transporter receptor subunit TctC
MAEAGLPDYEFKGWMGVVVPAGTPQPIIKKLNAAMRSILAKPESIEYFAELGSTPVQESPEDFATFLRAETRKWVRSSHDRPQRNKLALPADVLRRRSSRRRRVAGQRRLRE